MLWLHGQFGLVGLLALFLRGGILSLPVKNWGWAPQVAIIPAAVFGTLTMVGAIALLVRLWAADCEPELRWRMLGIAIVGYLFALRLIYLGQVELLPEEAYYWNYSQHLDIGYLDHPPMVAWLIWLGTAVFGNNEFGVRVGAFGCWLATSYFVCRLTYNLFDKSSALVAVLLVQVLPFFFSVGFIMTPDAPLVSCWSGALFFAARALISERRNAWWGVGVCIGLGMISKYSIGVLGPAMLLFLLLDSRSRRWFLRWEPYAAALVAALIFSPVIVWNFQHGWASFGFQSARRLSAHAHFSLPELIASILVLLTPTGALAALLILFRSKAFAPANGGNCKAALAFHPDLHPGASGGLCGIQPASSRSTQLDWSAVDGGAASDRAVDLVFAECSLAAAVAPRRCGCQPFWSLLCSTPPDCITSSLACLALDTASRFSWCQSAGGISPTRLARFKRTWSDRSTRNRSSSECSAISSPVSSPSTIRTAMGHAKRPDRISSAATA